MFKYITYLPFILNAMVMLIFQQLAHAEISEFKLTVADKAGDDAIGWSVSVSGDYAIVGAPGDAENGSYSGGAYLFKRMGKSWEEESKLFPSDRTEGNEFGSSVSISGDYVVVGARGNYAAETTDDVQRN